MPSPKAVLHDIEINGLDHKKAYTRISASGTLTASVRSTVEIPKLALKKLVASEPTAEDMKNPDLAQVELPAEEEKPVVEQVETPVPAVELSKPAKYVKAKVEKKETSKVETLEVGKKADDGEKA